MFKKEIILDSILGTSFIISLILLFQFVKFFGEFRLLDPIADAIGDVELTDLVFSKIRESPPVDKNVILVNIGELSRKEIAREIQIINQYHPAVIGIDSYFWNHKEDLAGDSLLHVALLNVKNLVLVSELKYNQATDEYDSIKYPFSYFNVGYSGYANLETDALDQHQFKVCRSFPPKRIVNGQEERAFSVKVCEIINSEITREFLKRDNAYEIINYRGNIMDFGQTKYGGRYTALDISDVFQKKFTPDLIKDKIVLFGFLGEDFNDRSWEDKFYTPLNVKYAGRSNPDMFGLVIHANIISMILNNTLINKQGQFSGISMALLICFMTVLLFTLIYYRLPQWYDGLTKMIQLIGVVLLLTVNVFIFHWFNYKANLTLATIMIALAGDSLEVCYGLIKNLFSKGKRKLIFKIHRNEMS